MSEHRTRTELDVVGAHLPWSPHLVSGRSVIRGVGEVTITFRDLCVMKLSVIWILTFAILCLLVGKLLADEPLLVNSAQDQIHKTDENEDETPDADTETPDAEESEDDTPDIDTETTVDYTQASKGLTSDGDLRPIFDYFEVEDRDGTSLGDDLLGARMRFRVDWGFSEAVHIGARIAGSCFTDNCAPEFVLEGAKPASNGLKPGQFTLDELYIHWFRTERGSIAVGRLQTRFVVRGGVFAKSLDRNNSNNVNINWTDGLQATYRAANGWNSSFILEQNTRDGGGSIRRRPLDFDDSDARKTYFVGFENRRNWGPIVQRGFDVSYLPASLLKDGITS